jgi:hypothetical protein
LSVLKISGLPYRASASSSAAMQNEASVVLDSRQERTAKAVIPLRARSRLHRERLSLSVEPLVWDSIHKHVGQVQTSGGKHANTYQLSFRKTSITWTCARDAIAVQS